MPYRSHVVIDLEQIAREAPLGGRLRRRRTRMFVIAVVLAGLSALWLVLQMAFSGVRHMRPHPYALSVPASPIASGVSPPRELEIVDVSPSHDVIPKEQLRVGSAPRLAWLHECYRAAAMRGDRDLVGVVHVRLVVEPYGTTTAPTATLGGSDPLLRACIERTFSDLSFGYTGAAQPVEVEVRAR